MGSGRLYSTLGYYYVHSRFLALMAASKIGPLHKKKEDTEGEVPREAKTQGVVGGVHAVREYHPGSPRLIPTLNPNNTHYNRI